MINRLLAACAGLLAVLLLAAPVAAAPASVTSAGAALRTAAATTAAPVTTVPSPAGPSPFSGLGAWVDVFDWSPTYTKGRPTVRLADIDLMAKSGVDTLYVQTSRFDRREDVLDPRVLDALIKRAHLRGMRVVTWYLPTFVDPARDLRRLLAAADLPVDGLAVDIESRMVANPVLRSGRLLDLSRKLAAQRPNMPLGAIVMPPVVTQTINPLFWPRFPWAALPNYYDAALVMGYWTNRKPKTWWHSGSRYTAANIDLVRKLTGRPAFPVHVVGGLGSTATLADTRAMVQICKAKRAAGCGLYDWSITRRELLPALTPLSVRLRPSGR